ncbi:hypothetical protein BJ742DRAFT_767613 [Cladochytrium replicatum]|nr:hypothetical protein BJ742DRAFT_767613 [Cladochytrium replicatum]
MKVLSYRLLVVISFLFALAGISVAQTDSSDSPTANYETITISHGLDDGPLKQRGIIRFDPFQTKKSAQIKYESIITDAEALELVQDDKSKDYRVTFQEGEKGVKARNFERIVPLCQLKAGGFNEQIVLELTTDAKVFHIDYVIQGGNCTNIPKVSKSGAKAKKLFRTTVSLGRLQDGARPLLDTLPELRPDGAPQVQEKSFFAKYWYIILPIVLLSMMGGGGDQQQ